MTVACTLQKAASELAVLGFQFPKCHCNFANVRDIPIDMTLTLSKRKDHLLLGASDIVQMLERDKIDEYAKTEG